jgi:PAS domain S-box-containing protein
MTGGEQGAAVRGTEAAALTALLLFDRQGRLLRHNGAASRLLRSQAHQLRRGLPYRQLLVELGARAASLPHDLASAAFGSGSLFEIDGDIGLSGTIADLGDFGYALALGDPGEAAQALQITEARYRELTDLATDWVWTIDADFRFTSFSPSYLSGDDLPIETVLGKTRWQLVGVEDPEAHAFWRAHLADLRARRPFRNLRHSPLDAKGRRRHFRVSGNPVFGPGGEFRGYHGITYDETGEIEARNALTRVTEAAEQASRAKSDFLASMSHEFRTPLNAIIGFSEMLMLECFGPLTAKQREYLQDIRTSGDFLLSLIGDILDITAIEARGLRLVRAPVDLAELLESCARIVEGRFANRGANLNIAVAADLPAVEGDGRRLRQILINILTNAFKFTPAGGLVAVKAKSAPDGWTEIVVSDTGIGIAPDDLQRVTEPFFRAEGPLERSYDGAGLGLPIAKALVELHGGELII